MPMVGHEEYCCVGGQRGDEFADVCVNLAVDVADAVLKTRSIFLTMLVMRCIVRPPQAMTNGIGFGKNEDAEVPIILVQKISGGLGALLNRIMEGIEENFAASFGIHFIRIDDVL